MTNEKGSVPHPSSQSGQGEPPSADPASRALARRTNDLAVILSPISFLFAYATVQKVGLGPALRSIEGSVALATIGSAVARRFNINPLIIFVVMALVFIKDGEMSHLGLLLFLALTFGSYVLISQIASQITEMLEAAKKHEAGRKNRCVLFYGRSFASIGAYLGMMVGFYILIMFHPSSIEFLSTNWKVDVSVITVLTTLVAFVLGALFGFARCCSGTDS